MSKACIIFNKDVHHIHGPAERKPLHGRTQLTIWHTTEGFFCPYDRCERTSMYHIHCIDHTLELHFPSHCNHQSYCCCMQLFTWLKEARYQNICHMTTFRRYPMLSWRHIEASMTCQSCRISSLFATVILQLEEQSHGHFWIVQPRYIRSRCLYPYDSNMTSTTAIWLNCR